MLDKFKINYFKYIIATRYVIKKNLNLEKITIFQKYIANIRKLEILLKNVDNRLKFNIVKYIKSRATQLINLLNFSRKIIKIVVIINYLRCFFS